MNSAAASPAAPAPLPPVPPFEWSFLRHETFQTCLRRYWYAYYGAWGGWRPDAPEPSRTLYRLKRLATRRQWAARHVHRALERILSQHRAAAASSGTPSAPPAELASRAVARELDLMRDEFRDSRAGAVQPPQAAMSGLFEHEYRIDVPVAEWKELADGVSRAVSAFRATPLWQRLAALPPDASLPVERRASFLLDGLTVRAAPNLAFRENGGILLLDWTTADAPPATRRLRLGASLLLALDRWAADPAQVRAVSCDPRTGEAADFAYTAGEAADLREFIRDSADEMLFPLEDPEHNIPGPADAYDCTADPAPCATCPFLRLCPRWQR